jgi:large subunit ribosomal protein L23
MELENVIKRPLLTEKVAIETENNNRYAFEVDKRASKHQIKDAVERLFNVKVLKVGTSVTAGKTKRFGRFTKKMSSWKKAYVTISKDQKIELFKGI